MAGTKDGGINARDTNRAKYGADFYARIGAIGGKKGRTGGFAYANLHTCDILPGEHKRASCAGFVGGRKSKRKPSQK